MSNKLVLEAEIKSDIGSVVKDTEEVADNLKEIDAGTKAASSGFAKMGTAVKGLGTAMKAAGIGLIVAGFAALKVAMESNQTVMDTVKGIMDTIATVMNKVVNVLTDTVVWVTASAERFNGLSKVIQGIITIALTPLKVAFFGIKLAVLETMKAWEGSFLGGGDEEKLKELRNDIKATGDDLIQVGKDAVQAGKDIFNNFSDAVTEIGDIYDKAAEGIKQINIEAIHEQSKLLVGLQNTAKLAAAELQGLVEENDRLAEVQRQIRDDETKTLADRIAANEELGRILDQQEIDMTALADKRVAAAQMELDTNKDNIDLQVALKEAQNERAGVEAQIAGFRSEQMTNEVALNKELEEAQKTLGQAKLSALDLELQALKDSYDEQIKLAKRAGVDTVAITEEYERKKSAIVKANTLEQISVYGGLASALSTLAGENKELAAASAIIDTYVGANKALASMPPPGNYVAAASVVLSGLANVKKIYATDVPGSGGSAPNIEAPAPQFVSGAFDLNAMGGIAEPEPVQAYVVTDDMTNSQNKLAQIRRRATI